MQKMPNENYLSLRCFLLLLAQEAHLVLVHCLLIGMQNIDPSQGLPRIKRELAHLGPQQNPHASVDGQGLLAPHHSLVEKLELRRRSRRSSIPLYIRDESLLLHLELKETGIDPLTRTTTSPSKCRTS